MIRRNERGARVLTSTCETTFTWDALSLFRSAIASRTIQIFRAESHSLSRDHTLGVSAFHKSLLLQASIIRIDLVRLRCGVFSLISRKPHYLRRYILRCAVRRHRKNIKCFYFFLAYESILLLDEFCNGVKYFRKIYLCCC